MITFDEALAIVARAATPSQSETVSLAACTNRFLAENIIAQVASPPADVSAMDGYAIREQDLPSLKVVGASYPGTGYSDQLHVGEAVRIFTGATVPSGADRVIVQEIVRLEGDTVHVTGVVGKGRHIRPCGSDFQTGDVLLPAGRLLDPRGLVAAAGADVPTVTVWRKPRVAVLGTGDELVEPGNAQLACDTIPESVSFGVVALVEHFGGECVLRERLPDQLEQLRAAAERALSTADLTVMTGGASVGERDYAKSVFAELGLELEFSKVAIKPGKPVWFGRAGGKLVMGLPGNPTSALVTARLLLAPLVRGLAGGEPNEAVRWRKALLGASLDACGDRETFVRARWDGELVQPLSNQDSGAQRALAEADLLIRRRPGVPATRVGRPVEVIDF